jgi:hypothetical protein
VAQNEGVELGRIDADEIGVVDPRRVKPKSIKTFRVRLA